MLIAKEEFSHPTQASRVFLSVFQQPGGGSPVEGMPDEAGFLVTESWLGASPNGAVGVWATTSTAEELPPTS